MLKVKQALDFCVNIYDMPIPKYALYGCVSGVTYFFIHNKQALSVYKNKHWEKVSLTEYPTIHNECVRFMCEGVDIAPKAIITTGKGHFAPKAKSVKHIDFVNKPCEYCEFRKVQRAEAEQEQAHIDTRKTRERVRALCEEARDIRACGPQEKRPGGYIYRARPTAHMSYDSNGIACADWEEEELFFLSREEKKAHDGRYNGLPVFEEAQEKGEYINKPFEGTRRFSASGAPSGKPKDCTVRESVTLDKSAQRHEARANARVSAKATTAATVKTTTHKGSVELFNYNQEAHRINKMCGSRIVDPVASL